MPAGPVVMPGAALSRFRAPMFKHAERLRQMGRNGDTILAHINPAEAMALHATTDGMTYNPYTGLPEFFSEGDGPDGTGQGVSSGAEGGPGSAESPDDSPSTPSVDDSAISDVVGMSLGPQGIMGGPASMFNPTPAAIARGAIGMAMGPMSPGIAHTVAQQVGNAIAGMMGPSEAAQGAQSAVSAIGSGGGVAPGSVSTTAQGITNDTNAGGSVTGGIGDGSLSFGPGPSFTNMPIPAPGASISAGPPLSFPPVPQRTRRQPYDPLTYAFGPQKSFYDYSTPMARGGLARAAQRVAKAGRRGDSTMVHMAPEEVGALSRMGRMTRNPHTGMPEAFSLKKALKWAAPVAGAVLGNYLGGPLGSAAGGALGNIVTGGNVKDALLTGALSYGVGKLGQLEGLGGTGLTSLSDDWSRLTSGGLGGGGTALDRLWNGEAPDAPLPKPAAEGAVSHIAGQGGGERLAPGGAFGGSDLMKYAPLGLLALSSMTPQQQQQAVAAASQPGNTGMAAEGLGVTFPAARRRKLRSLADFDSLTAALDPTQAFYEYEHEGEEPVTFNRGGLARYAHGRMVRGPGDGTQDAIPARLSDGEFVVPSAAVSAIGNGSSAEGGRRLDRMVSSVMRQKYGSPNRIPPRVRTPSLSALR